MFTKVYAVDKTNSSSLEVMAMARRNGNGLGWSQLRGLIFLIKLLKYIKILRFFRRHWKKYGTRKFRFSHISKQIKNHFSITLASVNKPTDPQRLSLAKRYDR